MNYIVCIPSYKRSKVCNDKTLTTLKNHNIPKNKIYVFVANKTEEKQYLQDLDKNLYDKLIVGKKGLVQQREFIMNWCKEGERIVFFDDDIAKIDLSMSNTFKSHSLDFFFKTAFDQCVKNKAFIWGVYPVFNPFFRKARPELSLDLRYIVGAFYGIINRPKLNAIKLTITKKNGQKEDVERTLRYFEHDQVVLRFDKIGFETKYYGKEGGLGTFEARLKPMEEATKKLIEKYPNYGSMMKKKTGMTEFKFKKIPAFSQIKGAGISPSHMFRDSDSSESGDSISSNDSSNVSSITKSSNELKDMVWAKNVRPVQPTTTAINVRPYAQQFRTTPLRGRRLRGRNMGEVSSLSDGSGSDFLSEDDSFELYQQRVRDGDFDPYDMGWNNSESFEEENRPIRRAPRQTSRCVPGRCTISGGKRKTKRKSLNKRRKTKRKLRR